MRSTKNMLLGLLIILFGISLAIVPLPGSLAQIIYLITPSSPAGPGVTVSRPGETLSWIIWAIIVIGIIITLIGYFRRTND